MSQAITEPTEPTDPTDPTDPTYCPTCISGTPPQDENYAAAIQVG